MNLTKIELEKMLKESIKKVLSEHKQNLDEISRNKKKKLKNKAIDSVYTDDDNVKTFCIITGENPMGKTGGNKLNRNANASLLDYLKSGNFAWQPIRGNYSENSENSKIIFNLPLDSAKFLGLKFLQQSFIYGRKEEGKTYFDLYVINEKHDDYELKETKSYYTDRIDAEDNYTIIDDKHKFNIPFEYFNEACIAFNNIINETKRNHPRYANEFNRFLNESLLPNKTGYYRYIHNCLLYGGLFK